MAGLASVWLNYVELAPRLHSACQVSTAIIMQLWAFISLRPSVTPSSSFLTNASIIISTPPALFFYHTFRLPLDFSRFATCRSTVIFFFFFFLLGSYVSSTFAMVCVCFMGTALCAKTSAQRNIHPPPSKKKTKLKYTHRLSSRLLKQRTHGPYRSPFVKHHPACVSIRH